MTAYKYASLEKLFFYSASLSLFELIRFFFIPIYVCYKQAHLYHQIKEGGIFHNASYSPKTKEQIHTI